MKTMKKTLLADARCCLQKQGIAKHSDEKNGASRSLSSQVSVGAQKHCKKQYKINIFQNSFQTCSRCLKMWGLKNTVKNNIKSRFSKTVFKLS